jgi:exopolysaccharide biosynthesis polyprenyl glycosylphosphotransferase
LERALRLGDHLVAASVALLALQSYGAPPSGDVFPLLVLLTAGTLAFPLALSSLGLYSSQRRESLWHVLRLVLVGGGLVAAVLVATTFALDRPGWSQAAAALAFAQGVVFALERVAIHGALRLVRRRGRNVRRIVVVGSGPRARAFVSEVAAHPAWGLQVEAFVDDGDVPHDPALAGEPVWKLIDFPQLAKDRVIDEVVVALPRSMLSLVTPISEECARLGIPFCVLSGLFSDVLPTVRAASYGRFPVLRFAHVAYGNTALALKRCLDIVGAASLLVLCAPALAAAVLAIRLSSRGPLLYRQTRVGQNGRPFELLKLRSMVVDADARLADLAGRNEMDGPVFKMRADPRVTRVGRVLRRWSIDELPQLWNVLRGEMSLVGPRPPLPREVDQYQSKDRRRISVRPGITCLWQISGRNKIQFAGWVELDLHYIDHWSLWLDLWILVCTPLAVIRRDGAS